MPSVTVLSGLLLIAVGILGYSLSNEGNPTTALIPAGFGIILLLLGVAAAKAHGARKHIMHAAVMVGALGLLMSFVPLAMALTRGIRSTLGFSCVVAMAVICGVYIALCVKSFIDARKARVTESQ